MQSSNHVARLLEALSDDVNFRIARCLVVHGASRTNEIAAEVGVPDTIVSKRLNELAAVDLVRRAVGRAPHALADPRQTERALREIRRLSISVRRTPLAIDEAEFASDEALIANPQALVEPFWGDDLLQEPERPVLWQATDEPGIIRLGPDEGVLLRERQPLAVINSTYVGFRTLVAGVGGGDLELNRQRAMRRAKLAVKELLPAWSGDHLQVSRHSGWRDATDYVYGSDKLVKELRRYRRLPDDAEPHDNELGPR